MYCYDIDDIPVQKPDPCSGSPCGSNARCNNGICTCLPEYFGDPYLGCRPECVFSADCSADRACIRNKCVDPCPGTCGRNSLCNVINHTPMCSCPSGTTGNAFISCDVMKGMIFKIKKNNMCSNKCELMLLFSSRSSVRNKTVQSESLRSKQHMSRIKWTGRVHVRAGIPWITTPLPTRVHS